MENSTRQGRATVTKLKPKHISRLVDQPDTSLDQLHKLKFSTPNKSNSPKSISTLQGERSCAKREKQFENTHSSNLVVEEATASTLTTANTNPSSSQDLPLEHEIDQMLHSTNESLHVKCSEDFNKLPVQGLLGDLAHLQDHTDDIESTDLPSFLPASRTEIEEEPDKKCLYKKIKKAETKLWLNRFKELEMGYKFKQERKKIEARLRALVNDGNMKMLLGMVERLIAPRKLTGNVKFMRSAGPLYDIVLEGLAKKGNLNATLTVLNLMDNNHVEFTLKTYACLFECVRRNPSESVNVRVLKQYIDDMKQKGWTLNDIFMNVDFVRDQRESVLEAIQLVYPDFVPSLPPLDFNYEIDLLKDINQFGPKGYISPAKGLVSHDEMSELVKEQIKNEEDGYISVPNIWNSGMDPKKAEKYKATQAEVLEQWEKCLTVSVRRLLDRKTSHQLPHFVRTVLFQLSVEDIVKILMRELIIRSETSELFSFPVTFLRINLGDKVKHTYHRHQLLKDSVYGKLVTLYQDFCHSFISDNDNPDVRNCRHLWLKHLEKNHDGPSPKLSMPTWPREDLFALGATLYSLMLKDCRINANILKDKPVQMVPAFYTVFRTKNRKLHEELKPHPAVSRLFSSKNRHTLSMDVKMVPMVCPPVPWTSTKSGGYILTPLDVIRATVSTDVMRSHFLDKLEDVPISSYLPCFDALNQLGSIPWKVNGRILDLVIEVFTSGGDQDLAIPLAPSDTPITPQIKPNMTREEKFEATKQAATARRKRAENYSLWCDALYRIALASYFRNRIIWLPHNMDFRGRVYPIAPYLQHMSGDMARSLLCFARGEPLGPQGLDWLKIHLVNLTGLKKKSNLAERISYAEEMMPEIQDSAKNPLNGRKWWMQSEEPWQTLAIAMEIVAAIESGNPESYVSHFPIHQDGSCNGLQHYAALGRDAAGAKSVNLTPESLPQDVYACVAEIVERKRANDAANGVAVAQDLEGFVRRKIIKQTIMTTVYGVTKYGARLQIARQLNALKDFDKDKVWAASLYLTSNTFSSLNETFTSTKEIQNWLTECAQLISQIRHECVEWTTPLGLPVIQPYTKPPSKRNNKDSLSAPITSVERPYVMKQRNAFPPNFIHSLDSTHMMLTALYCERAGITFVSVHDCFWVHARNVATLGKICREQFVALHSQPILEDLSNSFCEKFGYREEEDDPEKQKLNKTLKAVPKRGTYDLKEVLKSAYFFS